MTDTQEMTALRTTEKTAETAEDVLSFWFAEGRKEQWFQGGPAFDTLVEEVLGPVYRAAAEGAHDDWANSAEGALALTLLLDQVPRNIHRNSPQAFASDAKARGVTHAAIEAGFDRSLSQIERVFLYLPLEHSEEMTDQELCCRLMEDLDENPDWLDYAHRHREVIARFGRFPHRNEALGRESTPEEIDHLAQPGAGF